MLSISPLGSHISCPYTQRREQHELRSGPFSASLQGPRAQQMCTAHDEGNTKPCISLCLSFPAPLCCSGRGSVLFSILKQFLAPSSLLSVLQGYRKIIPALSRLVSNKTPSKLLEHSADLAIFIFVPTSLFHVPDDLIKVYQTLHGGEKSLPPVMKEQQHTHKARATNLVPFQAGDSLLRDGGHVESAVGSACGGAKCTEST